MPYLWLLYYYDLKFIGCDLWPGYHTWSWVYWRWLEDCSKQHAYRNIQMTVSSCHLVIYNSPIFQFSTWNIFLGICIYMNNFFFFLCMLAERTGDRWKLHEEICGKILWTCAGLLKLMQIKSTQSQINYPDSAVFSLWAKKVAENIFPARREVCQSKVKDFGMASLYIHCAVTFFKPCSVVLQPKPDKEKTWLKGHQ